MEAVLIAENIENQSEALGVKIESNFIAYQNMPNQMEFWCSGDSLYNKWGDNLTVSGEVQWEFIDFISPKTILCNSEYAKNLKILQQGEIMAKEALGEFKEIEKIYFDEIKAVHNLLINCDMTCDFESFMLDTLYRLRNGFGAISCIYENDELVATAICPYITGSSAMITAVAVHKNHRRKNYGKKVMLDLESKLCGRKIFLLKEKGENDIFYKKLNYEPVDSWVLGEL